MTLDQMLCRLPIILAQLKAENNSENIKNGNYNYNYCILCFVLKI